MNIKQFFKVNIIVPIVSAMTAGPVLFFLGEIDDAPGLCLIAVVVSIGLLYLGLHKAKKIDKRANPNILLPLSIGIVGIVWIAQYFIRGVYDESPGFVLTGIVVSLGLISMGMVNIKRMSLRGDRV